MSDPVPALLMVLFIALVVGALMAQAWVRARRHTVVASQWNHSALIVDGRFVRWLEPGRHVVWGHEVRLQAAERRALELAVPLQEILTSDGASVRVSLSATYRVVDPDRWLFAHAQPSAALYGAAQLALRAVVGVRTLEAVALAREDLSAAVLEALRTSTESLGVEIERAEVRDLAVLGELRKSVAAVLQARLEGQAALEKARAETAALRSLANAARMMDDNPNLLNLRLLQTIEGNRQASVVFDPRPHAPNPVGGDSTSARSSE